jgi:hypothetical protein
MSKWKYTLPNSKELRKAIEDEDSDKIFREIINAYKWMETHFGEDNSFEIRHVEDDLEVEAFDEDIVNMHLEDFWDACDARRVWVEL